MKPYRVTLLLAILILVAAVTLLAPPAVEASCPPDAVQVGPVCVDKYEASVWQIPPTNTTLISLLKAGRASRSLLVFGGATQIGGTTLCSSSDYPLTFPRTGNWTAPLYAASIPGVIPSACITWFQAEQACALSGKRLLTNQEWQRAAAGTVDPGSIDGLIDTKCNTNGAALRSAGHAGATPGGADSCISKWGVEDMIGNVAEWVADWAEPPSSSCTVLDSTFGDDRVCFGGDGSGAIQDALVRGGAITQGTVAGVFNLDTARPYIGQIGLGFRCAR